MPAKPYRNCAHLPAATPARRSRWAGFLVVLAIAGISPPHEWSALRIGNAEAAPLALLPMPFEQRGHSFPGSAYYYLADDPASSPLPPADAGWDGAAAGPAAQRLPAADSALDRVRALTCLTQAVYYEAATEPESGQRAVAQVVLNRVAHPHYPKTVCGVVFQGAERATGCQFTFTCDGAMNRAAGRVLWLRAQAVARAALAGYVHAPVGLATHYHSIAVQPHWAGALRPAAAIGAHRFYRLTGAAGAPGVFRPAFYIGNEPAVPPRPAMPGGLPALLAAVAVPAADVVPASVAPASPAAPALHAAAQLPGGGEVRAEFANSGAWLGPPPR